MAASDTEPLPPPGADAAGRPSHRSLERAAEWYASLRADEGSERVRRDWQAWLDQSPEHARAWAHVESVGRKFEALRAHGREAAVAGASAARRAVLSRRRALNGLAGLAVAGLAGWLGWRHTPLPGAVLALGADHHTGVGERRELLLDDGSRLWLDTDTAIDVDQRGESRRLRLRRGQILVQTAPDPRGRAFFVETGFARLQALGTRFAVRAIDERARLDVYEGAVEVRHALAGVRRVAAGQGLGFDAWQLHAPDAADRAREAWSRGVLLAEDLPLQALVDELARYRRGHLGVAPEVARLRVMGVYPADDPERALAMLEASLPVRVRRPLPWWVTLEAR